MGSLRLALDLVHRFIPECPETKQALTQCLKEGGREGRRREGKRGKRNLFPGGQDEGQWVESQDGELPIPLLVLFIAIPSFAGGEGGSTPASFHLVMAGLPFARSCLSSPGARAVTQARQHSLNPNERHWGKGVGERVADDHILERWAMNSTVKRKWARTLV